jgi:hypothetical protein
MFLRAICSGFWFSIYLGYDTICERSGNIYNNRERRNPQLCAFWIGEIRLVSGYLREFIRKRCINLHGLATLQTALKSYAFLMCVAVEHNHNWKTIFYD